MRFFIDAGHRNNVYDFGATSSNTKESVLSLAVVIKLADALKRAGHEVFYSRTSESDVISLQDRTKKANAIVQLDWYISIHMNSFSSSTAEGFEVLHYGEHETMSKAVCDAVCARTHQKNRGAKIGNLHVLRESYCKALLIECGFISHPTERLNLLDDTFQNQIVEGILEAFGITIEENTIDILLNGISKKVNTINKDGYNYVKLRDLADEFIEVSYDAQAKKPIVAIKKI